MSQALSKHECCKRRQGEDIFKWKVGRPSLHRQERVGGAVQCLHLAIGSQLSLGVSCPIHHSCWPDFLKPTLLSRQFLFRGAAFGTLILFLYLANVIILKNSASLPLPEGPSYAPPSHLDLPRTFWKTSNLRCFLIKFSPSVPRGLINP